VFREQREAGDGQIEPTSHQMETERNRRVPRDEFPRYRGGEIERLDTNKYGELGACQPRKIRLLSVG